MQGSRLTRYRLVGTAGLGSIRTQQHGSIDLANITDEQAELLHRSGSRYIEKVAEAPTPSKLRKLKSKR